MGLPVEMVFNPDITMPDLTFHIPVARVDHTQHLGVHLDIRLDFSKHMRLYERLAKVVVS